MNKNRFHIVGEILLSLYLIVLFVIMPLYIRNYNMLGVDKWKFFSYVSFGYSFNSIYIPGFLILIGLCLIIEIIFFKYDVKFSKRDLCLLLYLIVAYISSEVAYLTYFVSDKSQVIIGASGWYMGLAAQFGFILIYFYTKQYWKNKKWFFNLILFSSSLVFILGILNRFGVDLFGLFNNLSEEAKLRNISTMGNINWYACYLILIFPVSIYSYLYQEDKIKKILYALCFSICLCSLVTQGSDSVFLALVFIAYILFINEEKSLELSIIGSFSLIILGIFQRIFSNVAYVPTTLSYICTLSIFPFVLLAVSIVLFKLKKVYKYSIKIVKVLLPVLVLATILYVTVNSLNLIPEAISFKGYLYFDDNWGNNRGVIWRMGITSFIEFVKDHLYVLFIGAGPEQFYNMVYHYNYYEFVEMGVGVTSMCAHNEFLNTLFNYGALGLLSLYGFWLSIVLSKSNNTYDKMLKLMIVAYLINSIVSIQQIEAAPLLFACAGMFDNP